MKNGIRALLNESFRLTGPARFRMNSGPFIFHIHRAPRPAERGAGGANCPGPPALGAPSRFLWDPSHFFGRNISVFRAGGGGGWGQRRYCLENVFPKNWEYGPGLSSSAALRAPL